MPDSNFPGGAEKRRNDSIGGLDFYWGTWVREGSLLIKKK